MRVVSHEPRWVAPGHTKGIQATVRALWPGWRSPDRSADPRPRPCRTVPGASPRSAPLPPPRCSRRTAQPHWAGIEGRDKRGVATRRDDERVGRGGTSGRGAVRAGATSGVYGHAGGFRGRVGRWGRTPPCRRAGDGPGAGAGRGSRRGPRRPRGPRSRPGVLGAARAPGRRGARGGGIVARWATVRPMGRLSCSLLSYGQRGAPSPGGGDGR